MKITIEPTENILDKGGTFCRVWQGKTEQGVVVTVAIAMLCAMFEEGQSDEEFEQLKELYAPKKADRNRTTGN